MQLTWPELVAAVVSALGGQAILIAGIAWLTRSLVSHGMDRDLERYKDQLKANSDRELERLKNDLQMTALEHRVRFSRLHEERAAVIAQIYKLMLETNWLARAFIYGDNRDRSKAKAAHDKAFELIEFFNLHRLYIPSSVCLLLDAFNDKMFHSLTAIKVFWTDVDNPTPQLMQQQNAEMRDASDALEKSLPDLKKFLETEFRALLGVVDDEWVRHLEPDEVEKKLRSKPGAKS
jgi:hypothetical protein